MPNRIEQGNFPAEPDKENKDPYPDNTPWELRELGVPPEELADLGKLEVGGEGLSGKVGNVEWRLRKESEHGYVVHTSSETGGATDVDVKEYLEAKKEKYEGMTEQERAQHFWETRLQNEVRIEAPQNPACEFSVVIPVYNESPERILKQIESLKNQQDIDPAQFEIIYVVNNDLPSENPKSTAVIEANQKVIETLRGVSGLNIFVIDKSSTGNEIERCNVGKARNRGVAEASLRFYENGKNGLLIQTDADTYFEDPNYLSKLKKITTENPDVIGVAGGLVFEFNPDTKDEKEITELRKKVARFVLERKWDILVQFLRDPESSTPAGTKNFSGANMISRSYESAVVGGLIDANAGEDPQFGEDLEAYGAGRGQKVVGAKNDLLVVTALRESDRTASSFKKDFDQIDLQKPFMVSDPLVSETLPEFRDKIKSILEKSAFDQSELRSLLTNERDALTVSEPAFTELVEYVKENGVVEGDAFYRQWISKNFGTGFNLVQQLYDARHPQIPLTEENYQKLLEKVKQDPKGVELIDNLNTIVGNIRIP